MSRFARGLSITALGLVVAACRSQSNEPVFRTTTTVKEVMKLMVEPSADILWNAVATSVTATGTEVKAPESDEEWTDVQRAAVVLTEAMNLVIMPGRRIAPAGATSEHPDVELQPDQIEALVSRDRATWATLARGLQDAGSIALKAIEARDVDALADAGEAIDTACEHCHLKYWYPNKKKP
ncbi:MAG: hypothetical protein ABJA98_02540 [Acidobacteriota bacterium]